PLVDVPAEDAGAQRDPLVDDPPEYVDRHALADRPAGHVGRGHDHGPEPVQIRELERHRVSHPPSTGRIAPVMNDASSERRNEIAEATSSGSPTRATRSRSFIEAQASGERRSGPGVNR